MLPRILPAEDAEISELARKAFAKQGIAIHTEARVERLDQERRQRDGDAAYSGRRRQGDHCRSRDPRHRHHRQCRRARARSSKGSSSTRATSSSMNGAAPARPASTPSAMWSVRPGSRTRQATRAFCASRRSPASTGVHPLDKTAIPGCTYSCAASGERRPHRGGRAGRGPRAQDRPLPLFRQRQGDRARRDRRPGEDHFRRATPARCSAPI